MTRPPIVTNIDRKWALDQCPDWADLGGAEMDAADAGGEAAEVIHETATERRQRLAAKRQNPKRFRWDWFVDDQVASFERFFAAERRSLEEWSRLWRRGWWPQADPRKGRLPKSVAKIIPSEPHPFFKRGDARFSAALGVATPAERRVWLRYGVAQFRPSDPRLKTISGAQP